MRYTASMNAYQAHLKARVLRARYTRALVRRLLRNLRKWLDRPWARQGLRALLRPVLESG
jgi:hypothetical protein